MKRVLFFLTWLFLLAGCDKYHLVLTIDEYRAIEYSFRASSENEAKEIAVDYIDKYFEGKEQDFLNCRVRLFLNVNDDPNSFWMNPFQWDFFDEQKYLYPVPRILKEQEAFRKEEGRKAYAGSLFGMSPNEVAQLPHFRHYVYVREKYLMYCFDERIGNFYYTVALQFGPDRKLYKVLMYSNCKDDKEFQSCYDDVLAIIANTYGSPDTSLQQMRLMEIWRIGDKCIYIHPETKDVNKRVVFVEIIDKKREEIYLKEQDAERERNKDESSSLF